MWKINSVMTALCDLAPLSLAMEGDPVGLMAGRADSPVRKVLVTLDITRDTVRHAISVGADLIVSHHNFCYKSVPRATMDSASGELLLTLCENRIGAICMHTNLDAANGGVNDVLAARLGLRGSLGVLEDATGIGRFGALAEPMTAADFAAHCKKVLGTGSVRFYDAGKPVLLTAVLGGGGRDDIALAAQKGCDSFVTGDMKHRNFLEAKHQGINVFDCGHFATEAVILVPLQSWIQNMLPELDVELDPCAMEPYQCL